MSDDVGAPQGPLARALGLAQERGYVLSADYKILDAIEGRTERDDASRRLGSWNYTKLQESAERGLSDVRRRCAERGYPFDEPSEVQTRVRNCLLSRMSEDVECGDLSFDAALACAVCTWRLAREAMRALEEPTLNMLSRGRAPAWELIEFAPAYGRTPGNLDSCIGAIYSSMVRAAIYDSDR